MISYEPLYEQLDKKRIKLTDLSQMIGLSSSTLSVMLNDGNITANTLSKICNVLNCSVGEVICFKAVEEKKCKTTKIRASGYGKGIKVNWDKIPGPLSKLSVELGFASNYLTLRKGRDAGLEDSIIKSICEKCGISEEDIRA